MGRAGDYWSVVGRERFFRRCTDTTAVLPDVFIHSIDVQSMSQGTF